jgi:DNA processing protein
MDSAERRATAALWSIRGVGPVTLRELQARFGAVGELLERPVAQWIGGVEWRGGARAELARVPTLAARAEWLERTCRARDMELVFPGQPAWPDRLKIADGPPLLFVQGPGGRAPRRRRLAIVGSRHPLPGVAARLQAIASEAARHGLGIVSGAAEGIDSVAHAGALAVGGETWAFMGAALDQLDSGRLPLARSIRQRGGTLFSEFPPGFRANMNSFKLRNRLISGASDAVLVFQAKIGSGSLFTANAAFAQGRRVLVTPGEPWNDAWKGGNQLLAERRASLHLSFHDLWAAVGLEGSLSTSHETAAIDPERFSAHARAVFSALDRGSIHFEGLCEALPSLSPGQLSAALVELEVFGAVIHKGGRRYEKR